MQKEVVLVIFLKNLFRNFHFPTKNTECFHLYIMIRGQKKKRSMMICSCCCCLFWRALLLRKQQQKFNNFYQKYTICACLFHENSQQNLMLIFFVFVFWMRNFCFSYFPTKDSSSMLYLRRQDYFWSVGCLVWLFLLLLLVARFSFLSLNSEPR